MIYTVTVNPALDYVLQLEKVNRGEVNRTNNDSFLAGVRELTFLKSLTN